ncbi:MAG: succinate--CoA ligase subunit alpha [Candidatus Pacebacteria bacterium]|nr:succinate--CoA ligase subunit alpha [Candidatus Paceibacterota bacterium]
MAILINQQTKVLVQGITGTQGSFHAKTMLEYGTKIVTGVTPGKGGQEVAGVPVFNTVAEAQDHQPADWSIIFVPARFVKAAALEALESGLNVVVITEGVPVMDSIEIIQTAQKKGLKVIGPNCPGLIVPEQIKLGIMPAHIFKPGKIGVVSRSGTLTYEVVQHLVKAGLGQSTVLGIGGDPIVGTDFTDALEQFSQDDQTEKIVLLGEIGGNAEETAAAYIKENIDKPVVAYIGGRTAPEGKTMGHAGAIVSGESGKAETKIKAFESIGVKVAQLPSQIPGLLK